MQVVEVLQHHRVDVQVSFLSFALLVHHTDEIAEPVGLLVLLVVVIVELADVFLSDARQRAAVGADEVFYLPHVEQVLGNGFLADLLGDIHLDNEI